jgi:hypothetical protein
MTDMLTVLAHMVSHRAGAHWLPHSRAHEPETCDWDVQTYEYWLDLMRQEEEQVEATGSLGVVRSGLKVSERLIGQEDGRKEGKNASEPTKI